MSALTYKLIKKDDKSLARLGEITTPHSTIDTPCFMPVGTQGTVKTLTPEQVKETGAQILLGNTYHLFLQPGHKLIEQAGGLHKFMNWNGSILTDSGGFQVFSLAKIRDIKEEGVYFKNPKNGDSLFISPEIAMEIQNALGSDIMMSFDECPPYPATREYMIDSVERTIRWAKRGFDSRKNKETQALFGIVQGGVFPDLRELCAKELAKIPFDGYSIGGLSVGEPKELQNAMLEVTTPLLPENKPRYLMGVGSPGAILDGVERGVDMFDCVLPTRIARHSCAMTSRGRIILKNAKYTNDFSALDSNCHCYCCTHYTKAYLHHLFKAEEMLAYTLLSIHNITFLEDLMKDIRLSIKESRFLDYKNKFYESYGLNHTDKDF